MSKPRVYDQQGSFLLGYNAQGQRSPVQDGAFAATTNMRVLPNGEMAKRPGMVRIRTHGQTITGLATWYNVASARQEVVWCDSTSKVYYGTWDADAGTLSSNLVGTIGGSGTFARTDVGAQFRDAAGNDTLYLPVGGQRMLKYAGFTQPASTPTGIRALWVYNQRLFGVTGTNNTLYWSPINDGDTLGVTASGGGSASIRTYGNAVEILGGFALGNTNFILHGGAISVFRGLTYDDIAITAGTQGLTPAVGALNTGSWIVVDQTGYLVTPRGFYLVSEDGVLPYQQPDRTDPIRELLDTYQAVQAWPVLNHRAQEVWVLCEYAQAGESVSYAAYIYSLTLGRFTGHVGLGTIATGGTTAMAVASGGLEGAVLRPQLFVAAGTGIFACDFMDTAREAFQDDGTNYTSSVRCRRFFFENQTSTKSFRKAFVTMGSGALGGLAVNATTGAEFDYTPPYGRGDALSTEGGTDEVTEDSVGLLTETGTLLTNTDDLAAAITSAASLSGQGQYLDVTITDHGDTSTGWSVASVAVEAFDMGARGR